MVRVSIRGNFLLHKIIQFRNKQTYIQCLIQWTTLLCDRITSSKRSTAARTPPDDNKTKTTARTMTKEQEQRQRRSKTSPSSSLKFEISRINAHAVVGDSRERGHRGRDEEGDEGIGGRESGHIITLDSRSHITWWSKFDERTFSLLVISNPFSLLLANST